MKREKASQVSCLPNEDVGANIKRNLHRLRRCGKAKCLPHFILPAALLLAISGCASRRAEESGCGAPPSAVVATHQRCNASTSQLFALANPMQGTDSQFSFSHGNLYPAIALPFPMNVWAPYTEPAHYSFYYQYRAHKIYGIRQTHQPSPWIGDYANFALMPVSGKLAVTETERVSTFSHKNEIAQPSYYKVHLNTWDATVEVTPTLRAVRFRFTFDRPTNSSYVVLDVFASKKPCSVEIIPSEHKITGVARNARGGTPADFGNYFVIQFDQPFSSYGVWSGKTVERGVTKLKGKHVGAFLKFDTKKDPVVNCKVASSFINLHQAELNLRREIGNASFDTIRLRAEKVWDKALGRIRVEGGFAEQRRTFYTSLYESILFPHRFYELNAKNQPVYFSPYDGKVHHGYLYTDSGYWDTFRAANPLYNLLFPKTSVRILQGIINAYKQGGSLPEWTSPGYRVSMIGNHAFSVLAGAWMDGITNFDAQTAVAAMVHDANDPAARNGAKYYNSIGYVPYSNTAGQPSFRGATSKTIGYSYDDFCAAQLAHAIGENAVAAKFLKHAMNYTNVYDPKTGFMRGRRADGLWNKPFYANEWGGPFTEGSAWQWTFNAMQDEPGLATLMGGKRAFANKLDAMFAAPSTFRIGTHGHVIHEMTEMASLNMGQYAANNEPVSHVIYLYDYVGEPWKAQVRLRQAMTWLYQPTPDGLSGDDDTGQMSSWFVFSALGFYPVCPGSPDYLIGSPLFNEAVIHLDNGKTFTLIAKNNGPQEFYIQSATLNGKPFNQTWITHKQIMAGGKLVFQMGSAPNHDWGASAASCPPSPLAQLEKASHFGYEQ